MQNLVKFHIPIVALDDFRTGLDGPNDALQAAQLVGGYLGGFVEQYDVAELQLLDDEVLDVVLFDMFVHEVVAAGKLALHPQGIHHGDDAVKTGKPLFFEVEAHAGHGGDGLCDGFGLADAACLDDDVVETLLAGDVAQLLHEVHLQRATDAAVLQGHQTVVLLIYNAALLN